VPIEFRVRPEHDLAVFEHVGSVPDGEFLSFYRSLYDGGAFNMSLNQLVDLRKADSRPRSPGVLRQLAEYLQTAYTGVSLPPKVAVVAPEDLSYGLARMYEFLSDSLPWEYVVFRSMDAALAWLELPEDLMDC
jgi:hypothetical protein